MLVQLLREPVKFRRHLYGRTECLHKVDEQMTPSVGALALKHGLQCFLRSLLSRETSPFVVFVFH